MSRAVGLGNVRGFQGPEIWGRRRFTQNTKAARKCFVFLIQMQDFKLEGPHQDAKHGILYTQRQPAIVNPVWGLHRPNLVQVPALTTSVDGIKK